MRFMSLLTDQPSELRAAAADNPLSTYHASSAPNCCHALPEGVQLLPLSESDPARTSARIEMSHLEYDELVHARIDH